MVVDDLIRAAMRSARRACYHRGDVPIEVVRAIRLRSVASSTSRWDFGAGLLMPCNSWPSTGLYRGDGGLPDDLSPFTFHGRAESDSAGQRSAKVQH